MTRPQLLDVVRLTVPMPEHGLDAGEIGTIVVEFDSPNEAYEVEFSDNYGRPRAMFPLTPDQFEVVWSVALGEWIGEAPAVGDGAVAVGDKDTPGLNVHGRL